MAPSTFPPEVMEHIVSLSINKSEPASSSISPLLSLSQPLSTDTPTEHAFFLDERSKDAVSIACVSRGMHGMAQRAFYRHLVLYRSGSLKKLVDTLKSNGNIGALVRRVDLCFQTVYNRGLMDDLLGCLGNIDVVQYRIDAWFEQCTNPQVSPSAKLWGLTSLQRLDLVSHFEFPDCFLVRVIGRHLLNLKTLQLYNVTNLNNGEPETRGYTLSFPELRGLALHYRPDLTLTADREGSTIILAWLMERPGLVPCLDYLDFCLPPSMLPNVLQFLAFVSDQHIATLKLTSPLLLPGESCLIDCCPRLKTLAVALVNPDFNFPASHPTLGTIILLPDLDVMVGDANYGRWLKCFEHIIMTLKAGEFPRVREVIVVISSGFSHFEHLIVKDLSSFMQGARFSFGIVDRDYKFVPTWK